MSQLRTIFSPFRALFVRPEPLVVVLLIVVFVRGILYASVIPPWQAPDEPAHFERARAAISATDWNSSRENPPVWYDDLRDSLFNFRFAQYLTAEINTVPQQPLWAYIDLYHEVYKGQYSSQTTYALIGLPLFLFPNNSVPLQLYLTRINNALMNVGIVYFAYATAVLLFPKDLFLRIGVPLIITFIPQHTFILSTVTNGNLAELFATIALYLMLHILLQQASIWKIGLLFLAVFAAMWSKATGYFLIFPLITLIGFYLIRFRKYWRTILLAMGAFVILSILFAPDRTASLFDQGWGNLTNRQYFFNPQVPWSIFRSFWAMLGWLEIRVDPFWYYLMLGATAIALVGLLLYVIQNWKTLSSSSTLPFTGALVILAVAVGSALSVQLGWHVITGTIHYAQGRSLFPVIVPIVILLMMGWKQLLPPRVESQGFLIIITAFILFDFFVLSNHILPFFYSQF